MTTETVQISLCGQKLEVTGNYSPFRKGASPAAYYGPTPDEPEQFEVEAIHLVDDSGKAVGPDIYDLLDGLMYGGVEAMAVVEDFCLEQVHERAGEREP